MHAPLSKLPPELKRLSRDRRRRSHGRRPVSHIALPGYEIATAVPRPRETVTAFLRRTGWASRDPKRGWHFRCGLPTILELNGAPVSRKEWRRTRIAANDNVRFISRPLGGDNGGKQILGLVALVAVSAFAMWAGPALAGALGATGTAATVIGGVATAGIAIGGSLLINSLTAPKLGATNGSDVPVDQIYSAQAQGNTARLGQPLPVGYGNEKKFCDFAATPWAEFVGNDQYLNILLSVGMGKYAYNSLTVDDTPFWDPDNGVAAGFSGATVRFYDPGEEVTLFPVNVAAAAEVTGQQLATTFLGPFVANPSGTKAQHLAIDFVFPAGCFTIDEETGELGSSSVTLVGEVRPIDDAGAATGDYQNLFTIARTYQSRSPIRDSVKVAVAEGRYEVRLRRTSAPLAGTSGTNEVVWAGLRAFLKGSNSFADVSTIGIRIKSSQSTQGSFRFGADRTRILPVWDSDTGAFVEQATRNPGWAFYDAATNSQYGGGIALSKADFNTIVNFAQGCADRGDNFDYTFETGMTPPEAFDTILTVARAKHFWLGDVISVVRDEWRAVPSMKLTDREVVRGSTQMTWTMLGDQDPDAVIMEYIDETTGRPAQVQYPPDSETFTSANAQVIRINGIRNRDHAYRETQFYYRVALYRRRNLQLSSEYEGRALTFGSVLRVQSELPMTYGQAGAVMGRSGLELTLSPAPSWSETGPYFIRVRRANGQDFGPVAAVMGDDASIAVLDADDLETVESQLGVTLDQALVREDGGEFPSFELGTADNQSKTCVLLGGQPNGHQCALKLVVDDERVHQTDGEPPILPTPQFPTNSRAPDVAFLKAKFRQGVAEPILDASWWPAEGARYYTAEVSYDAHLGGEASWQQIYEGANNTFSVVVDRAQLRLRVQATAERSGAYAFVDVQPPTIVIAPGTVAPSSLAAALREYVLNYVQNETDNLRQSIEFIAGLVAQIDAASDQNKAEIIRNISRAVGQVTASYREEINVAVGPTSAVASALQELKASIGDVESSLNARFIVGVTPDGAIASYELQATAEEANAGMRIVAFDDGEGGATGQIYMDGDKFFIGKTDITGFVPVFIQDNTTEPPRLVFNGDLHANGSIKAQALDVPNLAAVSANFGNATFKDSAKGVTGGLEIDFSNDRIVISRP